MPHTVNGIGTWYWGKDNLVVRNDRCEFCGNYAELKSYDTTLFFVVLFVPLFPLGRKRIFDDCPRCRRHRAAKLAQWEKTKADSILKATQDWQADRASAKKAAELVAATVAFHDVESFRDVSPAIGQTFARDADVQLVLGDANDHFGDKEWAESAYRAAVAIRPDDPSRDALAKFYLRQQRPADAEPLLAPILANRQRARAPLLLAQAQAYQAIGENDRAAKLVDDVGTAFPDLLSDANYDRIRRSTAKYKGTSKRIKSTFEGRPDGVRRMPWYQRNAGLVIVGGLALIAAIWYLGLAISLGTHTVAIVNGTGRGYDVDVNGARQHLPPHGRVMMDLHEGPIRFAAADGSGAVEPGTLVLRTNFWSRPFNRKTMVLNPDRTAVVLVEVEEYAAESNRSNDVPPPTIHAGQALYELPKADYLFEPFPQSLTMKEDERLRKTRISLVDDTPPHTLADAVKKEFGAPAAAEWARRYALLSDDDLEGVRVLSEHLEPAERVAFLRPHLADRPIHIEWHRLYQQTIDSLQPDYDVTAEYRKLLAANPHDAALQYLLARTLGDQDEAVAMFHQAAGGAQPCAYALFALSYDAMSQARFVEALEFARKARELDPGNLGFRFTEMQAREATGDFDGALELIRATEKHNGRDFEAVSEEMRLLGSKRDEAAQETRMNQFLQELKKLDASPDAVNVVHNLMAVEYEYASGDNAAYRATLESSKGAVAKFKLAMLDRKYADARDVLAKLEDTGMAEHLTVYIGARSSGDAATADAAWADSMAKLAKDGRAARALAAALKSPAAPPNDKLLRNWVGTPMDRALLLTALGLRYPQKQPQYFAAARPLNFSRQFPSQLIIETLSGGGRTPTR